jgi:hypothetical protein
LTYEYSSQNHDWDLTLHAAAELIRMGHKLDKEPRTGTLSKGFSFFTGGMVLSFAAIESFSASVAFVMPSEERFSSFDFNQYRAAKRFWDKMQLLMSAAGIEVDKGHGLFQAVSKMQHWRNLVTHASPYEVGPHLIENTVQEPKRLHQSTNHLQYAATANAPDATEFYKTAVAYIELVKARTGINPCASVTYKAV